ncbi:MAG TPA: dTMP kinase [Nevskiaceae bacterium]|nr:dTMP kinase [Nevskiaceae bacterium]
MIAPRRGRLIVLEGGEGAGKSTQIGVVRDWLGARGRRVITTREPGGSPLAEAIRGLVLGTWAEGVDAVTELLLIFAARAAHLHGTIRPALADDIDVVCDRFVDASYAYQGGGRGLDRRHLDALSALVLEDLKPDLVLLLDLPAEQGLARARARGGNNRFEEETLAFLQRVRLAYQAQAAREPERYRLIDARLDQSAVSEQIVTVLERWSHR